MLKRSRKFRRPSRATAQATKQDVHLLMKQVGTHYDKTDQRLRGVERRVDELGKRVDELGGNMEQWKDEIIGQFHIITGQLRHDFKGAFADRLQQHEERITRLEELAVP